MKTNKPMTNESFSYDIAGNRVGIYMTAIGDFDTWDVVATAEPHEATHYTVMVQHNGTTTHNDYQSLHGARHAFMSAVNQHIATINGEV
jgi:hypothetical protein